MPNPCEKTDLIQYMEKRMDRFESKIDIILEDRNKIKGFIIGVTGLVTLLFNIVILIFKK